MQSAVVREMQERLDKAVTRVVVKRKGMSRLTTALHGADAGTAEIDVLLFAWRL